MARRAFLTRMAQLAALPFLAAGSGALQGQSKKQLKILMKSAWGSDDPTKAAFPFSHGLALAEAGHQVQIYLLGEAVVLMRKVVADAVTPVGWPAVLLMPILRITTPSLAALLFSCRSLNGRITSSPNS